MDYFSMAMQALDRMDASAKEIDLSKNAVSMDKEGIVQISPDCEKVVDGKKLAEIYASIVMINGYVSQIRTMSLNSEQLMRYAGEYITNSALYQYVQMRLSIFDLKLKKMGVVIEKYMLTLYKKLLVWAGRGAICISFQAQYAAILGLIKGCLIALSAILKILDALLKAMGMSVVGVNMEGASFFFTIKSMKMSTKMPIVNMSKSIVNKLPPKFYTAIDKVMGKIQELQNVKIVKSVASAAKAGGSSIMTGAIDFGTEMETMPNTEIIRSTIQRAIDIIMSSIPLAEPLPKYERLLILKNPGFFIFLATGWCVAGRMCFGIVGY